eukprot:NODE_757_length_4524_cov_0.312768.p2 type:complete len:290 gc:universal NODE_757_length_4524_cov_0.312768:3217-4086(+)
MSQNPFHSQDSLFRFDVSGNLVVNFKELNSNQSNEHDDTTVAIEPIIDVQAWLQKCNTISCCTTRCINQVPSDELSNFKEKFQPMEKHEQELFIKGILISCQKEHHTSRKVFEYNVFPIGKLCRKGFCHLISISNQKLQNIITSMDVKWTKRIHGNTDKLFLHALTFEQKESILHWIKTFASDYGEPRPGRIYTRRDRVRRVRDTDILWLPADLTIVKIHGIYTCDENTLNINVETFRKYFKLCENIKIKSGKTDGTTNIKTGLTFCNNLEDYFSFINFMDLRGEWTFS